MSAQYLSARALADRWGCAVNTVYVRVSRTSLLPTYRFGTRSHRWLLSDVEQYEASLLGATDGASTWGRRSSPKRSRSRGPRSAQLVGESYRIGA